MLNTKWTPLRILFYAVFAGALLLTGWICFLSLQNQENSSKPEREKAGPVLIQNENWPMFRGNPALTGVVTATLPDKLRLLWKYKTEGPVRSSAAIGNGQVYIGSNDANVYSLHLSNGQLNWTFKTEGAVESSPCLLNGKVYVGSADSYLYAMDARTGKEIWKYETGSKILGGVNTYQKSGEPHPWLLIGSYDNILHCVDSVTGEKVWTYESGYYINGTPSLIDDKVVFGGCDAIIHVVSALDGRSIHEIEADSYIAGNAGGFASLCRQL
jgi:outer membrane protein assembly factor BamB